MRLRTVVHFCLVPTLLACSGASSGAAPEATSGGDTRGPAARAPYEITTGTVSDAMAGPHRSEESRARDRYRHPEETLAFFGFEPSMTVVELWPGHGWYSEILAPTLRDHGRLILATMDPEDRTFRGRFAREFRAMVAEAPEVYDQAEISVLFAPDHFDIAPEGSADLVVTFRSVHNWIRWPGHEAAPYFSAAFRALKPGGIFGVVQHRAPAGTEHGESGTIGYLTEEHVVALATAAGFELLERSEINANAADDHAHPEGVWSLPPTLRGGDEGRATFLATGESDRMTLSFRKPETSAPGAEPSE